MEPSDFAGWLTALSSLNAAQRRMVFRIVTARSEATRRSKPRLSPTSWIAWLTLAMTAATPQPMRPAAQTIVRGDGVSA
jgi:hypothetical protein